MPQIDGNCSLNSSNLSSPRNSIGPESDITNPDESFHLSQLVSSDDECSITDDSSSPLESSLLSTHSIIGDVGLSIPVVVNVIFQKPNAPRPTWYEHHESKTEKRSPIRKQIHRDNKMAESVNLPIVSVSNLRSLMPKINNFKKDILEREINLALLSEVWEKSQSKSHKYEIEKMFQMDGLKYISTPRASTKRGGGAAIVANLNRFSLDRLEVSIPYQLEVVWGILTPKVQGFNKIKKIVVCAFYSPPNSRKNTKLLDHLISTLHNLLTKYPNAGIILGGDKNKLNLSPLITAIPRLRQIVTKFTHKLKILDVILTNLHQFSCVPIIVPPVQPDRPGHGVPSDHSVPVAHPKITIGSNINEYKTVTARPLPESGI